MKALYRTTNAAGVQGYELFGSHLLSRKSERKPQDAHITSPEYTGLVDKPTTAICVVIMPNSESAIVACRFIGETQSHL